MNPPSRLAVFLAVAAMAVVAVKPTWAGTDEADQLLLNRQQLGQASGEQLYRHICQACHMPDGAGAEGAASYPALAKNPRVASAQYVASIVLHGRGNMPSFMARTDLHGFQAQTHVTLGDAEIAAVVNFVRSHFGNSYADELTAADVAALHVTAEESR